ncbi:hypothetical protein PRZ48_007792 [Zasmidium cellare]|uniref:Uncharacterized protein n=1 Tax=Zasmidium cellare TaxID=395010 RepID=A0ABR0EKF3_ZASCE|nr:hypothetical protein PRZ48_007792 [Zasmidium cellare]
MAGRIYYDLPYRDLDGSSQSHAFIPQPCKDNREKPFSNASPPPLTPPRPLARASLPARSPSPLPVFKGVLPEHETFDPKRGVRGRGRGNNTVKNKNNDNESESEAEETEGDDEDEEEKPRRGKKKPSKKGRKPTKGNKNPTTDRSPPRKRKRMALTEISEQPESPPAGRPRRGAAVRALAKNREVEYLPEDMDLDIADEYDDKEN